MDREWNGRPFIGGEREWDGGRIKSDPKYFFPLELLG